MFIKIPQIFKTLDVDWYKFKSNLCFEKYYSLSRNGGSYFYAIKNYQEFKNLLRPNLFNIPPNILAYCEFTGNGLVNPHRDNDTTVALNFYIDTDDGITIFYNETDQSKKVVNKKKLKYFEGNKNLIEVARFQATINDCYLLDVSQIHGIQKFSNKTRSMITARWNSYSYDEILNSLNF